MKMLLYCVKRVFRGADGNGILLKVLPNHLKYDGGRILQRMLFDHFCQLSSVAGLAIGKGVSSEDKRNTRLEAGVKFRCKLNQRRCFFPGVK